MNLWTARLLVLAAIAFVVAVILMHPHLTP